MKKLSTKMIVEAGLLIALAQILSYLKIFEAPYGGSVTLGSMIPIVIFSIRWGSKKGVLVGMVYGVLQFILGLKYSFHPLSIFLDYILAFGLIGLSGLFRKNFLSIILSITTAMLGRFLSHFVSGVILFGSNTDGVNDYLASLLYNGGYMLPELIISIMLVCILYKPLKKYLNFN